MKAPFFYWQAMRMAIHAARNVLLGDTPSAAARYAYGSFPAGRPFSRRRANDTVDSPDALNHAIFVAAKGAD